jgi:hypothetical protein
VIGLADILPEDVAGLRLPPGAVDDLHSIGEDAKSRHGLDVGTSPDAETSLEVDSTSSSSSRLSKYIKAEPQSNVEVVESTFAVNLWIFKFQASNKEMSQPKYKNIKLTKEGENLKVCIHHKATDEERALGRDLAASLRETVESLTVSRPFRLEAATAEALKYNATLGRMELQERVLVMRPKLMDTAKGPLARVGEQVSLVGVANDASMAKVKEFLLAKFGSKAERCQATLKNSAHVCLSERKEQTVMLPLCVARLSPAWLWHQLLLPIARQFHVRLLKLGEQEQCTKPGNPGPLQYRTAGNDLRAVARFSGASAQVDLAMAAALDAAAGCTTYFITLPRPSKHVEERARDLCREVLCTSDYESSLDNSSSSSRPVVSSKGAIATELHASVYVPFTQAKVLITLACKRNGPMQSLEAARGKFQALLGDSTVEEHYPPSPPPTPPPAHSAEKHSHGSWSTASQSSISSSLASSSLSSLSRSRSSSSSSLSSLDSSGKDADDDDEVILLTPPTRPGIILRGPR